MITGLLFAMHTAPAQKPTDPPTTEDRLKHTSDIIQQEVKPGADQLKKIEEVYKEFFNSIDELRKDNPPPPPPPPPPKLKTEMDKLVKERDERVQKILTADQFQKYLEAAKKFHPPHQGDGPDRKGPPPPKEQ